MFSFKQTFNFVPMLENKPQEFSEKQRHILEAAEGLFATKGYDGTSVRDIAQEAGVNIAMISYYFGSKEKLLQAVFEMRTRYVTEQIESMLRDETLEPMDKVFKLIDNYIERIMSQQQFHKIMVREQITQKDTEIVKLIQETKKRNLDLIKKLITEGQRKGAFKKNIDIPLMMMTMIGTANQLITAQHYYREMNNLHDLPDDEFQKLIKKKLSVHLKTLFKATLTYEH